MVVVRLKGGLGNQLFQYAYAYALSKELSQPLCLDLNWFESEAPHVACLAREYELYDLPLEELTYAKKDNLPGIVRLINNRYIFKVLRLLKLKRFYCRDWQCLLQNSADEDIPAKRCKNTYLNGYWQNPLKFDRYKLELCRQFTLPSSKLNAWRSRLQKEIEECNSVAVHVRRTDTLTSKGNSQGLSYYEQAIKKIEEHVNNAHFFVFSDDLSWCKESMDFGCSQVTFVESEELESPLCDYMSMRSCKNYIIAHSTYSWWAAWLGEKENSLVICPKFPEYKYLIPNNWVVI